MPRTDGSGMITGTLAAKGLPRILPARCQEKPGYTGLVLLSFRIREGVETLEQLRSMVNLWSQTLLSFVGSSGSSLKVLIPYQLTGGGLPTDEAQVALFQQYAYKRAAEYVLASTGIKPEEVIHDGTESFRLSSDPDVYYNPDAIPIEMAQPTEPLNVTSARIINQPAEVPLYTKMLPGYTRSEMDATKYSFICRELANGPQLDKEPYLDGCLLPEGHHGTCRVQRRLRETSDGSSQPCGAVADAPAAARGVSAPPLYVPPQ